MSVRLFVGNVPNSCTETDLSEEFSNFGKVEGLELKLKPDVTGDAGKNAKFAFVTIESSHEDISRCINHFSKEEWNGSKLYVTRARESFLERLKREREEASKKHVQNTPIKTTPVVNIPHPQQKLQNTFKRNHDNIDNTKDRKRINKYSDEKGSFETESTFENEPSNCYNNSVNISNKKPKPSSKFLGDDKKLKAEMKRLESMKKLRKDFQEKKSLIKIGLANVDQKSNKKIKFGSDDETEEPPKVANGGANKLFDNESDSGVDDDVHFDIKEQFEGQKGQKLLELQTRYKSDKRFNLDERFLEDDHQNETQEMDTSTLDEETQQLNILEQVLGVQIKGSSSEAVFNERKKKIPAKLGMPRFDPTREDHTKFLAETTQKPTKAKKSKKDKLIEEENVIEVPKVEVSKEVFYKVSDTLKESLEKTNQFSLRSLFGKPENEEEEKSPTLNEENNYLPVNAARKSRNPLDRDEKNPFIYDSSESEDEEGLKDDKDISENVGKAVWKEDLFFADNDRRFEEALSFFNTANESLIKDRRELKFLMKKRISNRNRKKTMFKKKIGGKRGRGGGRGRGRGRW